MSSEGAPSENIPSETAAKLYFACPLGPEDPWRPEEDSNL